MSSCKQTKAPAPAPPAAVSEAGCQLAALPLRVRASGPVVAVGDVHGDYQAALAALVAARVVDATGAWIGGTMTVVQVGDILDRGNDEQRIIDWFETLGQQAAAAGGQFIWLLGNHELMNVAGDFRYVTEGGYRDFADVPNLAVADFPQAPALVRPRLAAFSPGGVYAKVLSGHNVAVIVDDTVYAHAGVPEAWSGRLDAGNLAARCFAAGQASASEVMASDGPIWTREFGGAAVDCASLERVLATLQVKRMVVGHTVQPTGVTSMCDGKLWRIDVGLSAYYQGPIQALALTPEPTVLKGQRAP